MRDRINSGEFENKTEFPTRPTKPRLVSNATAAQARAYADALDLYEHTERVYRAGVTAYRKAENEAVARFEEALADEFGLTNHPKRNKVWNMAWENGHSCGLTEVLGYYEDYADLVL